MPQSISFQKSVYSLFLLTDIDSQGRRVRDKYHHLWCTVCGKVDEDKAIAEGIVFPSCKIPKASSFRTGDGFVLMNAEGRIAFEEIFEDQIQFQEIENSTPLFLSQPKKISRVQPGQRIYAVGELSQGDFLQPRSPLEPLKHPNAPDDGKPLRGAMCSRCGRFYEVSIRPDLYVFEPDEMLVGLLSENFSGSSREWVVAPRQAAQIKAAKIPYVRLLDYTPIPPPLR